MKEVSQLLSPHRRPRPCIWFEWLYAVGDCFGILAIYKTVYENALEIAQNAMPEKLNKSDFNTLCVHWVIWCLCIPGDVLEPVIRAVPRISLHTFTGVSCIQTGFLAGLFVFTPMQKVTSKILRKQTTLLLFVLNYHDYYSINTLFSLELSSRSLLHNDDLYTIFNSSYNVNSS